MIVSRVANESIRNTNKTEDSNKNRNEIWKNNETTPKYVKYTARKKTKERKRISKVDKNILIYDELSLNLKPEVNDMQLN
jgi:hypothetical protein